MTERKKSQKDRGKTHSRRVWVGGLLLGAMGEGGIPRKLEHSDVKYYAKKSNWSKKIRGGGGGGGGRVSKGKNWENTTKKVKKVAR